MAALRPIHVRQYEDGPGFPKTPEQVAAERAYREAFYTAVREALRLSFEELQDAITAAWNARRQTREQAEVHVPTYILYNMPDRPELDGDQIVHVAGHEPAAARARGRVQALEMCREFYWELPEVPQEVMQEFVLKPWVERLEPWVNENISTIVCPIGLADVCGKEQRAVLECFTPHVEKVADMGMRIVKPQFRSVRELMRDCPWLTRPVIEGLLRQGETLAERRIRQKTQCMDGVPECRVSVGPAGVRPANRRRGTTCSQCPLAAQTWGRYTGLEVAEQVVGPRVIG